MSLLAAIYGPAQGTSSRACAFVGCIHTPGRQVCVTAAAAAPVTMDVCAAHEAVLVEAAEPGDVIEAGDFGRRLVQVYPMPAAAQLAAADPPTLLDSPTTEVPMPCPPPCRVPECENVNMKGRGLCAKHYDRARNGLGDAFSRATSEEWIAAAMIEPQRTPPPQGGPSAEQLRRGCLRRAGRWCRG